jgi:hypothetical protein
MPSDIQGVIDDYGPEAWVYLMLDRNDPEGKRRVIRGKASTLLHFGLDALDPVPSDFYRRGTGYIGFQRYGLSNSNWRTIKAVIPEKWPSGNRLRAWGFSVNTAFKQRDLLVLARVIEKKGVPFLGFYNKDNSWIHKHVPHASLSMVG